MDVQSSDAEHLLEDDAHDGEPQEPQTVVYKRRWYILLIFSLMSTTQGIVWGTWGPIATSSHYAFGWTDGDIALLNIWGPICFILGSPFFIWLQATRGLRWATVVASGLVTAGAGFRCISSSPPLVTWLANVGQVLNALAGPVALGAFANLSATWFPAHQRTTSTAILSVLKGLGFRLIFIVGPLAVPSPDNSTALYHTQQHSINGSTFLSTIKEVRNDIMMLMYIIFGWCALLFLGILVYFPAKPPHPPSITAARKMNHLDGIKKLVRNKAFWMVAMAFVFPYGTQIGWGSVLDVNLSKINISQTTVGWLGFTAGTIGNASGLIVGRLSDIFRRKMKMIIMICYTLSIPSFAVFTLIYAEVVPFYESILWTSLILGITGALAPTPLFFELSCEVAWPVPEEINNGFLTMILNIPIAAFLSILMVPGIGTVWMNWFVLASLAISIPIMALFKEQYTRLDHDIDEHEHNIQN